MSKSWASMRPTSAAIVVFGVPALLQAAEQYATGFWRIFCLIGLLGVLCIARAWLESGRAGFGSSKALRRIARRSKEHERNRVRLSAERKGD